MIPRTPGQAKRLKSAASNDGSFRFCLRNNWAGKTFANRMRSFSRSFSVILSWTWIVYNLYSCHSRWTKKYNLRTNWCTKSRYKSPQNEMGIRRLLEHCQWVLGNKQHGKWKIEFDNFRSNCIPKLIQSLIAIDSSCLLQLKKKDNWHQ